MTSTTRTASRLSVSPRTARPAARELARLEMMRLARHPVLLAGVVFGAVTTVTTVGDAKDSGHLDTLGMPVTALTVGLPAMVAAHLLARSFERTDELVETVPTSSTARTSALCATALVPAVMASAWLVGFGAAQRWLWSTPEWMYGTLSHGDVWAVVIGHTVVAAAGGTLLGVAAGRWWHFRGSSVALLLAVAVWTLGIMAVFSPEGTPPTWFRWVRMFTPVNQFTGAAPDTYASDTGTGSPWWYLVWLLTLCALAALVALLKGSVGRARRRLLQLGAVTLAVSALAYGLAASGGNGQVVRTFPDGHSTVLVP
ncbi:hypothetical protein [Terrabacter sp. 2RAF25]|uniref:hypothetical protein n=1 Tax=Terrabacter sp. 2RAF25 TaxID=3232998 RepID=UPI003F987D21